MNELLEAIKKKLLCCHEWEHINTTSYDDCNRHLYKCIKCGKLKKVKL